jgi:hypothetical protein
MLDGVDAAGLQEWNADEGLAGQLTGFDGIAGVFACESSSGALLAGISTLVEQVSVDVPRDCHQ